MPYVDQLSREQLKSRHPQTAGELCYLLTREIVQNGQTPRGEADWLAWFTQRFVDYEADHQPIAWQVYAEIMGATAGTVAEFNRRGLKEDYAYALQTLCTALGEYYMDVVGPYEDVKKETNGDVFAVDVPARLAAMPDEHADWSHPVIK